MEWNFNTQNDPAATAEKEAEIERINGRIAEEETKMDNCCLSIGRQYVALHSADYEAAFAAEIQTIRQCESNIRGYREEMQKIKGVRPCPSCGEEMPLNFAFCCACGTRMVPEEKPPVTDDSVICSSCGNAVKRGTRFCIYCGSPMEGTPDEPPVQERRCPNCGEKLETDSMFCTECGTRIG